SSLAISLSGFSSKKCAITTSRYGAASATTASPSRFIICARSSGSIASGSSGSTAASPARRPPPEPPSLRPPLATTFPSHGRRGPRPRGSILFWRMLERDDRDVLEQIIGIGLVAGDRNGEATQASELGKRIHRHFPMYAAIAPMLRVMERM